MKRILELENHLMNKRLKFTNKKRMIMTGKCSRANECESYMKIGCKGCGFQHFNRVKNVNEAINLLKDEYFNLCSERKTTSGRIALDAPMKKLVLENARELIPGFPEVKELKSQHIRSSIEINGEIIDYEIKCDGAFEFNDKYVFYELKGYGDGTNDILSAITASQLLKEDPKFQNYKFYYIGVSSGKKGNEKGLTRKSFFDPKRRKVTPYTKWAESKGFIKFYGIVNVLDFLEDIKNYLIN